MGDEVNTFFWYDRWLCETPLCVRFNRLFELSLNKSCSVATMSHLGWEVGGDAWRWWWAWEEDLVVECRTLLHSVVLQPNISDQWHWLLDIVGGYTMRSRYQLLTSQDSAAVGTSEDLMWHKKVPLKVSILTRRLLCYRLPTKSNLLNHDVLPSEAATCSVVCGQAETTSHLFLLCDTHASMW